MYVKWKMRRSRKGFCSFYFLLAECRRNSEGRPRQNVKYLASIRDPRFAPEADLQAFFSKVEDKLRTFPSSVRDQIERRISEIINDMRGDVGRSDQLLEGPLWQRAYE